jgi:undecaprenyl-diphosphatase
VLAGTEPTTDRTSRAGKPVRVWALAALARQLADDFRTGWAELEPGAKRRWLISLGVGALLSLGIVAAMTLLTRAAAPAGPFPWERDAVLAFAESGWLSFHHALFWQQLGSSALLMPLALIAAGIAIRLRRPLHAVSILLAAFAIKPFVLTGWTIWARARPDFIEGGLAVPEGLHAFPSGHVAQTVALFGLLASFWIQRSRSVVERLLALALLATLIVVIGVARLRLGAHWPTDLVAGVVAGGAWCVTLYVALRRAQRTEFARMPQS